MWLRYLKPTNQLVLKTSLISALFQFVPTTFSKLEMKQISDLWADIWKKSWADYTFLYHWSLNMNFKQIRQYTTKLLFHMP